jgi:hypothetical protein
VVTSPAHVRRAVDVWSRCLLACAVFLACAAQVSAQPSETFATRLSPVPIDIAMQATIAGSGSARAVLTGTKVTVSGSFAGMKSKATTGQVYRSSAPGVKGSRLFDITVSGGTEGTFNGTATLTSYQVDDLRRGRLYVQINSESGAEGNLRGWLMREEQKR